MAGCVDDIALIRSMHTSHSNHYNATLGMHTGSFAFTRPSIGSWVSYGLGTLNRNLPSFVVIAPKQTYAGTQVYASDFLPGAHQGTFVDSQHTAVDRLIGNIRSPHAGPEDQRRQLDLLRTLNQAHRRERSDPRLDARLESFELAFRMQAEATDAFDTAGEPQHIRDLYGSGVHGRQTLIARRLLERGVRYVQLWHGAGQPWDHHDNIEVNHRKLAAEIDQPIAALLSDLKQRGLLEDTLIVWGGEFGRTTYSQGKLEPTNHGRDHHGRCFTMWLAGGGVKPGLQFGETDDFCFNVARDPMHVHDLNATLLHLLGIDHERLTYRAEGRDFRLTDVHGHVVRAVMA